MHTTPGAEAPMRPSVSGDASRANAGVPLWESEKSARRRRLSGEHRASDAALGQPRAQGGTPKTGHCGLTPPQQGDVDPIGEAGMR